MNEFKNGNILSLTLENFQTFKNQKFTFGPSLNFIAAPNGSGKSSVANAIAFVFNGIAKTIGKSKEMCDFIKFGCKSSSIEAEIFYEGEAITIKRTISLRHTQYFLKNRLVSQKDYFSFLKKINIDVNNLCTFLPQERVGEFCRMDGTSLLSESLKNSSIDLSVIREDYIEGEKIQETLNAQLKEKALVTENLNQLQENAAKFKETEALVERRGRLECKKNRIEFESMKARYLDLKTHLLNSKQKIETFDSEIEFLCKKIAEEEARDEYKEHKKGIEILKAQNIEIQKIENLIKSKILSLEMCKVEQEKVFEKQKANEGEIEDHKRFLNEQENEYSQLKVQFKEELSKFKLKMQRIPGNEHVREMRSPESIEDLEKIVPSFKSIDDQIQQQGFIISQITNESSVIQKQFEEIENKKKLYSQQDSLRLEALKKYHHDSYKAVLWLRENKHKFRNEILEPSYLHITIDKNYTDYVETFLSFQSLTSFVALDENDFSLLARLLKDEQSLGINIAMHSPCNVKRMSQSDIDRFKFAGVVSDFIKCRSEYLDFFNNQGFFNNIPISKTEVREEEVYDRISTCRRMAVNNRYSEIKRSMYDNDYVILTNRIKPKNLFNYPSFDVKAADEKIRELSRQRENNRIKFNEALNKKEELQEKKKTLKTECDITQLAQLSYKLEKVTRNIQFYKSKIKDLNSLDLSNALEEIKVRAAKINSEIFEASNLLEQILDIENIPPFNLEGIKNMKLDLDNFKRRLLFGSQSKATEEDHYKSLMASKDAVKSSIEDLKEKIRSSPFQGALEDLPETIIEIEAEMNVINSKLHFAKQREFDQEDYKSKEKHLETLNKNIDFLLQQQERSKDALGQRKEQLENEIKKFLDPLNEVFSKMFERFGFQGKLELDTSEKDWQLRIFVKFRENESLQQLSSYRQSGGEKSLTTVLFLLSLQQCQTTGFRLVDEINQGMDSTNERIVFEIIKEIGTNSQFFVITPKMLDNVEFSNDSKVIILFGGPGITKELENYCNRILG